MRRLCLTLAAFGLVALMADAHAEPPAAKAEPVALAEQRPAEEVSPAPKPDEWKAGARVRLARPLPSWCEARLVREWLRIRCELAEGVAAGGAVLLGRAEDVGFFMTRPHGRYYGGTTEVVMPLRRGDRRVVQLTRTNDGYEGIFAQEPLLLISAEWIDRDAGPVVTPTPTTVGGPFRGLTIGDRAEAEPVAKEAGVELKWEAPWVVAIEPGSPASKAGIALGDKLVNEGLGVFEDSAEAVHRHLVFVEGDRVKLSTMRGKRAKTTAFWLPIAPRYE